MNKPITDTSKPQCLGCKAELEEGYYIRQPGKPVTYIGGWICQNPNCIRYGLLTMLKLRKGQ